MELRPSSFLNTILPLFGILFLASAALFGCGGDGGGPTGPGDSPDPGTTPNPDSTTVSISTTGGSVLLPDGSGVVFPEGALPSSMPVTVLKGDPDTWFDDSGASGRVVLTTTAPVSQFNQEVEVRVPLPTTATLADTSRVLAGVIDEETGAVTVEKSTIRMIDGKPYLVVNTDHFTSRLFEWFFGAQPPSSAMLTVPYYNQGSSPFCWAASLHMVTQAANFGEVRLLADIIGKVGVDEGGIGSVDFRMNSDISDLVKSRTGVRPERKMWDYVNKSVMRDYLWREIGVNGHPVALFSSKWQHAIVIVGYDVSTFRIHDPASTRMAGIGYEEKEWDEFTEGMALNDKLVTLVIPHALENRTGPLSVNFLSQAVQFVKPFYGQDDPSAIYRYVWDHTRPDGYAFRHTSSGTVGDPLRGEVSRLSTGGDIQISNASRTTGYEASVYLDVTALGAPSGEGRLSTHYDVTVGPNSAVNLQVPDIKVDTFRYNMPNPVEYALTVSVLADGTTVDRQSIYFKLAPVTPEITDVVPDTAAIGEEVIIKGSKLGLMALNNTVTFNGTEVEDSDVVSWDDEEIRVKVPEGATDGPVLVKRGEVESEPLDFAVAEYSTVSGMVIRSMDLGEPNLNVTGSWSLQGVGASLDYHTEATAHHIFSVDPGKASTLDVDFSGDLNPAGWTTEQGYTYQFKSITWKVDTEVESGYGSTPVLDGGGSGGSQTFEFTPFVWGDKFRAIVRALIYVDVFDPKGDLFREDFKMNERTVAIFTVESS